MSITKIGENLSFSTNKGILSPKEALYDKEIAGRFMKMAKRLRRVAPKANEFLYAHAIMMHAAEASLIDQKTGEPILNKDGSPVVGHFEEFTTKNGKQSVRWVSPDNIMPYKNANGDIFGEEELKKAYKKWVGKPLCKDHKSDSVDGIRGIIIDTYYDPKFKRVHALFALDKKNYGDLARKVETGYANCVSMGTAVGRSVCTECGNIAITERDYCNCVRARTNFGEINLDLSPIELSLVVNGADDLAKIRNIIASINEYAQKKQARIEELTAQRCVNPTELHDLADSLSEMQKKLSSLIQIEKEAERDLSSLTIGQLVGMINALEGDENAADELFALRKELRSRAGEKTESIEKEVYPPVRPGPGGESFSGMSDQDTPHPAPGSWNPSNRLASNNEGDKQGALSKELRLLRSKIDNMQNTLNTLNKQVSKEENDMNSARLRARAKARRAYWLGGGGVNDPANLPYDKDPMGDKVRNEEDKQMVGTPLETGSEGLHPGDKELKKEWNRDGLNLSKAELQDRAMKRRAYWLGGGGINEPTPGKPKYEKEPMADKVRDTEDKQMVGTYDMGGTDGAVPGDMETKKRLLRAKLRAKFTKVADEDGNLRKDASRWDIYAGDKLVLTATGDEIFGDTLSDNWDYLSSREYGKDVIGYIRDKGLEHVAYLLKGAAPPAPGAPEPAMPEPMPEMEALPPIDEAAPPAAPEKEPEKEDTKGKVEDALSKMEEAIDAVRGAISERGNKLVDVEVTVDKPDDEAGATPVEELTASNKHALEVHALMNAAADELALISEALEEEEIDQRVISAATQALSDSEAIFAEAALIVDAKKKKEDKEEKEDKEDKEDKPKKKKEKKEEGEDEPEDEDGEKEDKDEKKAQKLLDDALRIRAENRAALLAKATMPPDKKEVEKDVMELGMSQLNDADDASMLDDMLAEDGGSECLDCEDSAEDFVIESDASVKEARRKAREELVAQAADKILGKYELDLGPAQNATERTYFEAHPGGKGTVTEMTHTKTPEAKVETISEVHDVMRDVAESGPRNVREAAMEIQENIVKGAFKAEDLDQLVAEGKVDSAAAQYWKKYWAQGPDTGSFGADLTKEFQSKKKEASEKDFKVKLRRAYDLGIMAQDKNLIGPSRDALEAYVDNVMQFDDAAFESTKRIVANMNGNKKSGKLPVVGADAATEAMNVTASTEIKSDTLADQLSKIEWK